MIPYKEVNTMQEEHWNRKSDGHICFIGDFEYYETNGTVYKANIPEGILV